MPGRHRSSPPGAGGERRGPLLPDPPPEVGRIRHQVRESEARLRESETRLEDEAAAHRTTRAWLEEEVAARDARVAELEARLGSGS